MVYYYESSIFSDRSLRGGSLMVRHYFVEFWAEGKCITRMERISPIWGLEIKEGSYIVGKKEGVVR